MVLLYMKQDVWGILAIRREFFDPHGHDFRAFYEGKLPLSREMTILS